MEILAESCLYLRIEDTIHLFRYPGHAPLGYIRRMGLQGWKLGRQGIQLISE